MYICLSDSIIVNIVLFRISPMGCGTYQRGSNKNPEVGQALFFTEFFFLSQPRMKKNNATS